MSERLDTYLTTEAFVLSGERSALDGETMGRTSALLTTLSAGFVVLGLLGASAGVCAGLALFAGVTFARLLQCSVEDGRLAMELARIRRYCRAQEPEAERWLRREARPYDPARAAGGPLVLARGQMLLTAAGLVSGIAAILVGVAAGCVAAALGGATGLAFGVGIALELAVLLAATRVRRFEGEDGRMGQTLGSCRSPGTMRSPRRSRPRTSRWDRGRSPSGSPRSV